MKFLRHPHFFHEQLCHGARKHTSHLSDSYADSAFFLNVIHLSIHKCGLGKKNSVTLGLAVSAAGCLIAFLFPRSWLWVSVGLFVKCLGAAPANYVMMALFSDVLDHIEAKHGFRCDGISMSLRSIMMAVALSICQGIFNMLVGITGYIALGTITSTAETIKILSDGTAVFRQNIATENMFVWCYVGFMMVGYAICYLLLFRLNVEKEIVADQRIIRERQRESVLAEGKEWIDPDERMRIEEQEAQWMAEKNRKKALRK
jgi:GPH family glycoside/pentoside/hexuronide:cation symporter